MAEDTNKLSWVELKRAIAHSADLPEKDVSKFMQAFTELTAEALKNGEQVKINGLGTFKTQAVAARKSVNIATGEAIQLQGYDKLTFLPDYNAKQKVNDTAAAAADPMKKLSEQANEILDILADLGQGTTKEPETPEEPEVPEKPNITERPKVPKTPETPEKTEEPEEHPEPPKTEEKPQPRPFRPWLATGIIVSLFCLALIGGYIFLQNKIEQWVNTISERTGQTTALTQEEEEAAQWELTEADTTDTTTDSTDTQTLTSTADQTESKRYSADNMKYDKFITTETLTQGSRLAWLAYKYYGEKQLWVFIYDANKDKIAHPSRIVVGTKVKIPDLDSELRDVNNPQTQELIKELEHKFLDGRK